MAVNDLPSLGVDSGPETQANVGVEEFSGGRRINEAMPMILHLGSDDLVELDRYLRGTGMDGVRQVGGAENARCHDSECFTTAIPFQSFVGDFGPSVISRLRVLIGYGMVDWNLIPTMAE